MNDATLRLEVCPEVSAFVERVRDRLGDLSEEQREDLVCGLEADIAELVADGGSLAELGDPRAYADELRTAAGIERPAAGAARDASERGRGPLDSRRAGAWAAEVAGEAMDGARRRWSELVAVPAVRPLWQFLVTLSPVWWVLRAWVAMQLFDLATQARDVATLLPMVGGPVLGTLLWVAAVVLSVQIGRDRVWPGSGAQRGALARVVLLGLNAFAVVATPVALATFPAGGSWADQGYGYTVEEPPPGLALNGDPVGNVFPYDADGNPLTGVQLFTEDGTPLVVARTAGEEYDDRTDTLTVTYPWFDGARPLYNVFPLPRRDQSGGEWRTQPDAWTSTTPPSLPTPPTAVVPPASLPVPEVPPQQRDSENLSGR